MIDAAGNVGATDSQNVVIDTIAPDPAVKTIAISAITTDTGLIANDFVTSDTTLAVSGTLGRRFLPVSSRKSALMAAPPAESFGKRFDLDISRRADAERR